MALSAFLALVGVFGMMGATSVDDVEVVFVGCYMILFALTMFGYEAVQLCPCRIVDHHLKRNVGFMYGPIGKGLYLLL